MAQTMIASQMTDGQIENLVSKLRDACRKHREEITSEAAQIALGVDNIGMLMFAPFREQVEMLLSMIVRRVRVNRGREPQEVINATNRAQHTDRAVVNNMPRGEGEDKEVFFFKLGRYVNDADLQKEYELRGLEPDPYAQAQVNTDDPSFADERLNGCHWQDANGNWCFAAFRRWDDGKRVVGVRHHVGGWGGRWWFAGVRK